MKRRAGIKDLYRLQKKKEEERKRNHADDERKERRKEQRTEGKKRKAEASSSTKTAQPTKTILKEAEKKKKSAPSSETEKLKERLKGSRFRWLNEQMYTTRSEETAKLIDESPELFAVYHEGFRSQVRDWPVN